MKIKSILKNKVVNAGSWYIVTEFFVRGLSFLTIPIFTRLLSPADYGTASLYRTWVGFFAIIIGLELSTSITKAKFKYKDNFEQFVGNIVLLSFIVFTVFFSALLLGEDYIRKITGLNKNLIYLMIIQAYFTFIRTALVSKLRIEYKYKSLSAVIIFLSVLGELLSLYLIFFVFQQTPYMGRIIGQAIPVISLGAVILIHFLSKIKISTIKLDYWKFALCFSCPLIGSSLANIINNQFDRLIINQYLGSAANGIYSFACNIGLGFQIIVTALDQAWGPWVYERMELSDYAIIRQRGYLYRNLLLLIYAFFLFATPEIIKIMADPKYSDAVKVTPFILMGYFFFYMYTLELKTMFYNACNSLSTLGTVIACIVNVVLNFLFIPSYGYVAAAITTAIAYLCQFLCYYFATNKILKIQIYTPLFYIKSVIFLMIITTFYLLFQTILFARIIGFVLICIIFIYSLKHTEERITI